MKNKSDSKKKQFILFGLCSFLALLLCMATLVVTVKNIEDKTADESEKKIESRTQLTEDNKVLAEYIYTLTRDAKNNKFVKVNVHTEISVDDSKITVTDLNSSGSSGDEEIFIYAKNQLLDDFQSMYGDDYAGEFGKICKRKPVTALNAENVLQSGFWIGLRDENNEPVYDENSELTDEEYYYITLKADPQQIRNDENGSISGFGNAADTKALKKELLTVCDIENAKVTPCEYSLKAKINRVTDEIVYIDFKEVYTVNADFIFKNQLSVLGSKNIEFEYAVTHRYDYSYAGISFLQDEVTVESGEEICLNVNAVIEDDSEYTVTFMSSDEGIVSVDEMGYVKGLKACDVPAVITVKLDYMGESFTDECIVNVE